MFKTEGDGKWILTNYNNKLRYEYLATDYTLIEHNDKNISQGAFSHFELVPHDFKSRAIKRIAGRHGISQQHCVLIDDSPEELAEIEDNHIKTVGAYFLIIGIKTMS